MTQNRAGWCAGSILASKNDPGRGKWLSVWGSYYRAPELHPTEEAARSSGQRGDMVAHVSEVLYPGVGRAYQITVGTLATRSPAGPQATTCDGEIHTQADWGSQSGAIQDQLTTITDSAENMLRCLNAREAGRDHMTLAAQWGDQVRACVDFGQNVIDGVNTRQDPYVGAVQAAGGSAEVAQPGYYDEM